MDIGPAETEKDKVVQQVATAGGGIRPPFPPPPPGLKCHGGRYIQYNIYGRIIVVTAKYKHPVRFIGEGAYGFVCSAVNSETKKNVAIKKIANAFDFVGNAKKTFREIKILRHLNHPNIVSIEDIIPPPVRQKFNNVYFVYELMDTDLHQVIRSQQPLLDVHYQGFLYQILCGVKYMHSANVLHRDLKPNNILLNRDCQLKICDFGHARVTAESGFMTEDVVTRWYRPPELLLNSLQYSSAVDLWSVGCIYMELVLREALFPGKDPVHQLRLILELIGSPTETDMEVVNESAKRYLQTLPHFPRQSLREKFPTVDTEAIDLVEKMLTFDPRKRITAEGALAHKYLASLHGAGDQSICSNPFNFEFEQQRLSIEQMKDLNYMDALNLNPGHQQ